MSKVALCIKKSDVADCLGVSFDKSFVECLQTLVFNMVKPKTKFVNIPHEIISRDVCETDETYVQPIPYISLVLEEDGNMKFFIYNRGGASQEKRLVSKYSIGLGGHVEEYNSNGMVYTIAEAAIRELEEEVGIKLHDTYIFDTMCQARLLYNHNDAVGRVHLGFSLVITVNREMLNDHEVGVIEQGEWVTFEELVDRYNTFEPWSQMVIDNIKKVGQLISDSDCNKATVPH